MRAHNIRIAATAVAVAAAVVLGANGTPAQPANPDRPPRPDGRAWIVGTWRSCELDYGDFLEWKGAAGIELVAASPRDITLWLISKDGKRRRAADSRPAMMDEGRLSFGPFDSALVFSYRHAEDELALDLNASGVRIRAKLRRVPVAPAPRPVNPGR